MKDLEVIILLLSITILAALVAIKIKIAYPIFLVIIGLLIGLLPGLPMIKLDPDIALLVFLPPALYAAAWNTSWRDIKKYRRPISFLAIGCVLFTTSIIAYISSYLIPGFSLAEGFILGAIVSPPDAVAATSVTKGLRVPRRIITVLEGESLVNDASGLIAYRYAVAAVLTGQFVFWEAGLQFFIVGIAGVLIGFLVGYGVYYLHQFINGIPTIDTALTLVTPYLSFLLAEHFHFSGVLAVVTSGLFLTRKLHATFTHNTRLQANYVWDIIIFLLNAVIFIIIGLQLPVILTSISNYSFRNLIFYGLVISVVTMLIRIVWVFPGTYLPRILSKHIRTTETRPSWQAVFIVSWSGMRGIVSLAAALALPVSLADGTVFPGRDLIIFLTFCVILYSLVVHGLTLPLLIKKFDLPVEVNSKEVEKKVRMQMASRAITHMESNFSPENISNEILQFLKNKYELQIDQINGRVRTDNSHVDPKLLFQEFHAAQCELFRIERQVLQELRQADSIEEEILRKLDNELDLEESNLTLHYH
ncbi:Na+/H+ antiporter [Adhaeribacter pallidiroseus]|uniref:Putative Na(+)/H(+) exchanger n=1 Tax=Adhaeribacter pallidiroseus TaxID=2072847 RepID=A0A369QHF6_9BACT|nr:Na+/H+ antiporter [Adhaeribacter pallidiroseus]RDC62319.1 putative Na(+)/H(+) exchanger [Adhaeribacter pallidiroseus]